MLGTERKFHRIVLKNFDCRLLKKTSEARRAKIDLRLAQDRQSGGVLSQYVRLCENP